MPTEWLLATQGDPLGAVRRLVAGLWRRAGLAGFLVPAVDDAADDAPRLLEDAGELQTVNPFRPLMRSSTARFVPDLTRARPAARLGVLARPCEMRALLEMAGHAGFGLDRLVTVSVDCLSTLPPGDYARLAASRAAGADLGDEAVRFARQGGISPYRFRAACQMCATPAARDADVNVGVLGMPVREWLLVSARDPATAARLDPGVLCDGPATPALTGARARIFAQVV